MDCPAPAEEPLDRLMECEPNEEQVTSWLNARRLVRADRARPDGCRGAREDVDALGRDLTLSNWCDRTPGHPDRGSDQRRIDQMVRSLPDEGHATWSMPDGARVGAAWKQVAANEWGDPRHCR